MDKTDKIISTAKHSYPKVEIPPNVQIQSFDRNLIDNAGRPLFFDIEKEIENIENLMRCDEIKEALRRLDNLPGWYRKNYPQKALDLRKRIFKATVSIVDYCKVDDEKSLSKDFGFEFQNFPRNSAVFHLVSLLNKQSIEPSIYEYGPASFWVPLTLKETKKAFDYSAVTINEKALEVAKKQNLITNPEQQKNEFKLFLCMEVLEHLWHPRDLEHIYRRHFPDCDMLFITCPDSTCGGGLPNWDKHELGHVQTYTQKEFLDTLQSFFPDYNWAVYSLGTHLAVGYLKKDLDLVNKIFPQVVEKINQDLEENVKTSKNDIVYVDLKD